MDIGFQELLNEVWDLNQKENDTLVIGLDLKWLWKDEWELGRYRGYCWGKFLFVKKCWSLVLGELKHLGFEIILKIKSTSIFWAPVVYKALAHSVFSPYVSWLLLLKWTRMTKEVTLCLCILGHFCPGSSESQRLSQPWKGNAMHLWTPSLLFLFL